MHSLLSKGNRGIALSSRDQSFGVATVKFAPLVQLLHLKLIPRERTKSIAPSRSTDVSLRRSKVGRAKTDVLRKAIGQLDGDKKYWRNVFEETLQMDFRK
jgi:hypothetical protein